MIRIIHPRLRCHLWPLFVCQFFVVDKTYSFNGKGIPWKFNSSFTPEQLFKSSEERSRIVFHSHPFFFSDVLLLVFRKLILGVQPLKFPSAPKFAHAEFYQNDIRCLRSHTWNGWNAFVWLDFFWFEETLVNAPHHKVKLTLTPFLIEQMGWPPLTNMVNCQPRHDEASKLHSGKLNQQVRPPHENRPKLHQKGKVCIPLGLKSPLILTINIH